MQFAPITRHDILSIVSHPDDVEMHHSGLLETARSGHVIIATDGEASTVDYTRRSLCRRRNIAHRT